MYFFCHTDLFLLSLSQKSCVLWKWNVFCDPSSLPYRWLPALGAAGGEEGGAADRGGRQPEPRVPAHPRPARVPLRLLQGRPGRRQRRHPGEQGETHTHIKHTTLWMFYSNMDVDMRQLMIYRAVFVLSFSRLTWNKDEIYIQSFNPTLFKMTSVCFSEVNCQLLWKLINRVRSFSRKQSWNSLIPAS